MILQRELDMLVQIRMAWCELEHVLDDYTSLMAKRLVDGEPIESGPHEARLDDSGKLLLNSRTPKECSQ